MNLDFPELTGLTQLSYPMTDKEYAQLKQGISDRGYDPNISKMTAWETNPNDQSMTVLIDGRHRMKALKELGIPLTFSMFNFVSYTSTSVAERFVRDVNFHRRSKTMEYGSKAKRAAIKRELELDRHRSDVVIAELVEAGNDLVGKVREEFDLHSDQRVAANGREFNNDSRTEHSENEKTECSPVSPESASDEPNIIEPVIHNRQTDDQLQAKINVLSALSGKENPDVRRVLGHYMKSDLGKALLSHAPDDTVPVGIQGSIKAKHILDLRLGFPHIPRDWSDDHSPNLKNPTKRDIKKARDLLGRIDDLSKIDEQCSTMNKFDAGQACSRIWHNQDKPEDQPEAQQDAEVVPIGDHATKPVLKWYGETVKWWEHDEVSFEMADSLIQLIHHYHLKEITLIKLHKNKDGKMSKNDVHNLSRDLKLSRGWMKVLAGGNKGLGNLINTVASIMDRNAGSPQGEVRHRKYYND